MKRPKIVEQIIVVLLLAVLIPFVTIGIIISNVSQHSVRKELTYSVKSISQFLGENMENYLLDSSIKLDQIARAIPYFYYQEDTDGYLLEMENTYGLFNDLKIVDKNSILSGFVFNPTTYTIKLSSDIDDKNALSALISVGSLETLLSKRFIEESREVYILDIDNTLIASNMEKTDGLAELVAQLPEKKIVNQPETYGKIKNQPVAYYKLKNPAWTVIVSTSKEHTENTIDLARFRIILALTLAGLFVILLVGLYTYYLYINIRQLFKGIIAISKGSYERKIHLIRNVFSPHEILFLAKEFNYMAQKISQSYKDLSEKNTELARLDEFRTNLVNAISHEFRTPLTSIVGYASRLLRKDIEIDEKTQRSSLKTIKQQAKMLSRMVEDILVVPDIESFKLQLDIREAELSKIVEESLLYVSSKEHEFNVAFDPDLKLVCVDKYRMTQIFINLFENAIKYSKDDSPISIICGEVEGKVALMISNKSEPIKKELLNSLFDKFIRLDGALTSATRGTGLGLFIVKGLANAMGISVELAYDDTSEEFQVTLIFGAQDAQV